ncbi:MAG: hypothetical protein WC441_01805 [Patescibacteria group bacterium]
MSKKSIEFHVKSNDYFGTLATVLSLIKQTPENIEKHIKSFNKLEKDLLYLQNNYKIVRK